jgi:hypothetical protein
MRIKSAATSKHYEPGTFTYDPFYRRFFYSPDLKAYDDVTKSGWKFWKRRRAIEWTIHERELFRKEHGVWVPYNVTGSLFGLFFGY